MATTQHLRSPAGPMPGWETPSARSLRGAFRILASYSSQGQQRGYQEQAVCRSETTFEAKRESHEKRSVGTLGASAVIISIFAGAGEFLGYSLRSVAGYVADKAGKYCLVTFLGYSINLLAVPAMALAGESIYGIAALWLTFVWRCES